MNDPTTLGFALLGLLHQTPASGYDLRKFFLSSPMKSFSDSPGAIYPALRRLEKRGLIRSQVQERNGLRRRRLFRLTSAGQAELKRWATRGITRDDVITNMKELTLRFGLMDQVLGRDASAAFLKSLIAELNAYVPTLRVYLDAMGEDVPLSGKFALESGILQYETALQWARKALLAYERSK
jgi:DNA-binding PadR family transcriptional regulator